MNFYETHITVSPKTDIKALDKFCNDHKCKLIDIRLNKGSHKRQLMVTHTFQHGKDQPAIYEMAEIVVKMNKAGFKITRKKLESSYLVGSNIYFEAHWKLTFKDEKERLKEQNKLAQYDGCRISFNGKPEKSNIVYLTVRSNDMEEFHGICEKLDDELRRFYKSIKFHNERVIVDSNPKLDNGW